PRCLPALALAPRDQDARLLRHLRHLRRREDPACGEGKPRALRCQGAPSDRDLKPDPRECTDRRGCMGADRARASTIDHSWARWYCNVKMTNWLLPTAFCLL